MRQIDMTWISVAAGAAALGVALILAAAPVAADSARAASSSNDPHAHHRAMMNNKTTKASQHRYSLPDLALVGMDGAETTLGREVDDDRPVMLNFIFTTCTTICPVLTATFSQVQRQLGAEVEDVRMISITIDPDHDTPKRLSEYAERFGAGPQWHFLTGDRADIVAIQKAFDAYHGTKMNHRPITFLRYSVDQPWTRLEGITSAATIIEEYRRVASN